MALSGTRPEDFTEAGIKGICMNPAYAGIADFLPLISDKQWVAACKKIMEQDSPEQFLVNLLYLLRSILGYIGEVEDQSFSLWLRSLASPSRTGRTDNLRRAENLLLPRVDNPCCHR